MLAISRELKREELSTLGPHIWTLFCKCFLVTMPTSGFLYVNGKLGTSPF